MPSKRSRNRAIAAADWVQAIHLNRFKNGDTLEIASLRSQRQTETLNFEL